MTVQLMLSIALLVLITVALPIFIVLHFITRWKQSREFSRDDENMLEDLWLLSQRLNERLGTLERILDDDLPDKRSRYESTYVEH
jgi:phage shock protein B